MTRHTQPTAPERETEETLAWPARPALVELAAAILVVGGVVGLLGAVLRNASGGPASGDPFLPVTIALSVGSIAVGLLVRLGRLWILAVNYVAVLGFLDLLGAGASPLALMLGLVEVLVVVILLANKPWFDAMAAGERPGARRPAGSALDSADGQPTHQVALEDEEDD